MHELRFGLAEGACFTLHRESLLAQLTSNKHCGAALSTAAAEQRQSEGWLPRIGIGMSLCHSPSSTTSRLTGSTSRSLLKC